MAGTDLENSYRLETIMFYHHQHGLSPILSVHLSPQQDPDPLLWPTTKEQKDTEGFVSVPSLCS